MSELTQINTVDEVAMYLKVSTRTVYRLIKDGRIKRIEYLGRTRITKQAVEEFINT